MNIYLDDERSAPLGWIRTYTASETIELLKKAGDDVDLISLDHDLGDINETGYDVLKYIEEKVFTDFAYDPPKIFTHTANPVARKKMEQCIYNIYREIENRFESGIK